MPRVLLADDDEAVRNMLQVTLERDGFEVVAVASVSEALSRIAMEKFDVLLSDLHMPQAGDGFTVVSHAPYPPKRCDAGTQRWKKPWLPSAYRLTRFW